jgi:hypothetical protein
LQLARGMADAHAGGLLGCTFLKISLM